MAARDPTRPQLEFPALVAELISQLRLTGQVGRLNFSDEVIPAFLIGSRGINFSGNLPAFASPAVFTGTSGTPAPNTIVADSGPMPAGTYDLIINTKVRGTIAAGADIARIEHRDAGNVATLAILLETLVDTVNSADNTVLPLMGYVLGLNERVRSITPTVAMTTGGVSTTIFIQIRPTP